MCQGRFSLNITNKDFTERVVRAWSKLARKLESVSLEVFQRCLDVALGDII